MWKWSAGSSGVPSLEREWSPAEYRRLFSRFYGSLRQFVWLWHHPIERLRIQPDIYLVRVQQRVDKNHMDFATQYVK